MRAASIHFVGTATTLLRLGGFTLLTDPNFLHRGERVYLGYGMHSTRRTEPALQPPDLPPLDAVILSHLHEDHFDRVAERQLHRALPILTTPEAARSLHRKGFEESLALRTWQDAVLRRGRERLRVTAMPGRHGPPLVHRVMPQVMGSMIDLEVGGIRQLRMYISGDTLVFRDLEEIPRRFPDVDLALLHLGGTRIGGILLTMDGKQGVEAMRIVRPRMAIPIHYDDYEVFRSPLSDFQDRVRASGLEPQVHYLLRGETYQFGPELDAAAPFPLA
jgi:L-ascorbate metabolism protein UlaG (beta-lactamase superfamily)